MFANDLSSFLHQSGVITSFSCECYTQRGSYSFLAEEKDYMPFRVLQMVLVVMMVLILLILFPSLFPFSPFSQLSRFAKDWNLRFQAALKELVNGNPVKNESQKQKD